MKRIMVPVSRLDTIISNNITLTERVKLHNERINKLTEVVELLTVGKQQEAFALLNNEDNLF